MAGESVPDGGLLLIVESVEDRTGLGRVFGWLYPRKVIPTDESKKDNYLTRFVY